MLLTVFGAQVKSIRLTNMFFVVVNVATANRLGQLDPSVRVKQTNGTHKCTSIVLCNKLSSM